MQISIFKKMLIAPLISLALYTGFLMINQIAYQQSSDSIARMRSDLMPLVILARENIRLFDNIGVTFKDIIGADEPAWMPRITALRQQMLENIHLMKSHPELISPALLQQFENDLLAYEDRSRALIEATLIQRSDLLDQGELINEVEHFRTSAQQQLASIEMIIDREFQHSVTVNQQHMKNMMIVSGIMTVLLLLVSGSVAMGISLSIRRNLLRVVDRLKTLAHGEANFSGRLQYPYRDELGELVYWFNQLSDKLEADYKNIETISITDKLTQLNNRTRTDAYLSQSILRAEKTGQPLILALLDIDHFKKINDTHGHLAGDKVLQKIADILKSSASPGDFIGRWGGEEFILIFSGKDLISAQTQTESIRHTIATQTDLPEKQITASIGISQWRPQESIDNLIRRADDNLYQAKKQGRNRVVCQ